MNSTQAVESNEPGAQIAAGRQLGGKYMTFKLASEEYGLEILKVRDVIGLMEITRVPKAGEFIRGVINLRGKVIPIVDLKVKFGMERTDLAEQTVIITVRVPVGERVLSMGILVDEVLEVLGISEDQIEPPPDFGSGAADTDFILGIGKSEKRVIFLLDIGKALGDADTEEALTATEA